MDKKISKDKIHRVLRRYSKDARREQSSIDRIRHKTNLRMRGLPVKGQPRD